MTTSVATSRGVGYFRVSSKEQAGERRVSLEAQEQAFRTYCDKHTLQTAVTFTDVASGRKDDRAQYQIMLKQLTPGDTVVVLFLDRFGRNPREILRRYWELDEKGVSVVSINEDLKEELLLLIRAGMAGAESRRIGERTKHAQMQAARKGHHMARPPFGYKRIRDGDTTTWAIEPREALAIREMYRLVVEENLGYKTIADRLNALGYRSKSGKPFASYTLQIILKNPALVGTMVYGRRPRSGIPQEEIVETEGVFPAILSPEEWHRLQERLALHREYSRGMTHASDYLLSGIARCGYCGGPMVGKVGARKRGHEERYRNYYCSRAFRGKHLCSVYNGHSAHKLEMAILEYLGQFSDPILVREYLATSEGQDIARYEDELDRVEGRLKELERASLADLDRLDRGVITEGEYIARARERRSESANLEARRADLQALLARERSAQQQVNRIPFQIGTFFEDFTKMNVRRQKTELQNILKAAHVYRDGRIELEFRQ